MAFPSEGLLDGIKVLDLSSVGPASRASRILADYGAEVIKVSPPAAKGGLQIRPPFHAYGAGRGLSWIRLDLKAPAGREAFLRLAGASDVVLESFRPGVVRRLGIGFEDVQAVNPGIVYCSTTGYGQEGPSANWAGHDLNYLAVAGFLAASSPRADGGPPIPGATVADSAGGGMHAVIAILAGLFARQRTGRGIYLDVAATDGVLYLMSLAVDQYLATGEVAGPGRTLLTGRYACYDAYQCRDGKWISVAAIEPQFFANLCRLLGLEEYASRQLDDAAQPQIREAFRRRFAERDRDEWVERLAPNDTCVAPVREIPELFEDPQFRFRGAFTEVEDPRRGRFWQVGPVLAGCRRPAAPHRVRDPEATDTGQVLAAAGFSAEEIEQLRRSGVVE